MPANLPILHRPISPEQEAALQTLSDLVRSCCEEIADATVPRLAAEAGVPRETMLALLGQALTLRGIQTQGVALGLPSRVTSRQYRVCCSQLIDAARCAREEQDRSPDGGGA